MNAKRMSIKLTGAVYFLNSLLFALLPTQTAFGTKVQSSSLPMGKSSCQVMWEQHDKLDQSCAKQAYTAECLAQLEKAKLDAKSACGVQTSGESCESAMKELSDEEEKFNSACGDARIDGNCFVHINKCVRCQGVNSTDPMCESMDTVEIGEDETDPNKRPASINDILNVFYGQIPDQSSSSRHRHAPSAAKAKVRYKNCPAMSQIDLNKWMDKTKEAQQTVQDKKKEIVDLEERSGEIDRDLRNTVESIDEDAQKLLDEASSIRNRMKESLNDRQSQTQNAIYKILDEIDKIDGQIISANKAYEDAYSSYLNTLAQLEQQCHAAALQQLNARQIRVQQQIGKSKYSVGSFKSLASRSGVSDRKRAQRLVAQSFRQCKAGRTYKASAAAAKRALKSAQKSIKNTNKALRLRQDKLQQRLQGAQERELPQALQEVVAKANESLQKAQTQLQQLEKRKQKAIQNAAEKKRESMKKILLAKQELDVAEQALRQSQAYLNAKMTASGGVSAEAGKVSQAINAFTSVISSVHSATAACGCDAPPSYTTDKSGRRVPVRSSNFPSCVKVCTTLVKSSSDWNSDVSITDSARANVCEIFDPYSPLGGSNSKSFQ